VVILPLGNKLANKLLFLARLLNPLIPTLCPKEAPVLPIFPMENMFFGYGVTVCGSISLPIATLAGAHEKVLSALLLYLSKLKVFHSPSMCTIGLMVMLWEYPGHTCTLFTQYRFSP